MTDLGFTIIEPESLPFAEQVRIFANAKLVVCLGGAALYNIVFCRPKTHVITIESSDLFIRPHSRLLGSAGVLYGVVFGEQIQQDPTPVHKSWVVDIKSVINAIGAF